MKKEINYAAPNQQKNGFILRPMAKTLAEAIREALADYLESGESLTPSNPAGSEDRAKERNQKMKTTTEIQLPLVHMNGTGIKTLTEDYDAADDKLHDFMETWGKMEFNARDYYPHGPEAWTKALEARQEINAKIREIKNYINAHREHLYDQKKMKTTQKRAKSGGEVGANGEFYEGGKFIATKDNAKKAPAQKKPSRGYEIDNRVFVQDAPEGYFTLYSVLAGIHYRSGNEFSPNYNYLEGFVRLNPDADANAFVFEEMCRIDAWNAGERWRRIPEGTHYWQEEFSTLPKFK